MKSDFASSQHWLSLMFPSPMRNSQLSVHWKAFVLFYNAMLAVVVPLPVPIRTQREYTTSHRHPMRRQSLIYTKSGGFDSAPSSSC